MLSSFLLLALAFETFIFNLLLLFFLLRLLSLLGSFTFYALLLAGLLFRDSLFLLRLVTELLLHLPLALFLLLFLEQSLFFQMLLSKTFFLLSLLFILLLLSLQVDLTHLLLFFLEADLLFHGLRLELGGGLFALLHEFAVSGLGGAHRCEVADLFCLFNLFDQFLE